VSSGHSFAAQFFPGDYFSWSLQQRRQYLQSLLLQPCLMSLLPRFPGLKIDLKRTEAEN
jgi:hypothetical protein